MPKATRIQKLRAIYPVLNFLITQAGWWVCVLGAARGWVALPVAITALWLTVHMVIVEHRRREVLVVMAASLFGIILDSALGAAGILAYETGQWWCPAWLASLWIIFATGLRHAFGGLWRYPRTAALIGCFGGAGSYFAGVKLGALLMPKVTLSLVVLGAIWAVIFPAMIILGNRDRSRSNPQKQHAAIPIAT